MLRTILAVLASAVIMFIYGSISWGMIGWHEPKSFKDEAAVAEVLKANTDGHATYALPAWDMSGLEGEAFDTEMERRIQQYKDGPYIYATVRNGKRDTYSMTGPMFTQFIVVLLGSLTLVFLIQKSKHNAFLDRLSIAVLAGVLIGVMSALPPWVFMEQPDLHTAALLFDAVVQFILAGSAIALILPKKDHA